jgi:hypothetical protein
VPKRGIRLDGKTPGDHETILPAVIMPLRCARIVNRSFMRIGECNPVRLKGFSCVWSTAQPGPRQQQPQDSKMRAKVEITEISDIIGRRPAEKRGRAAERCPGRCRRTPQLAGTIAAAGLQLWHA